MTFLLDVNVLIALIDPAHINHEDAHGWFESKGQFSWATCPLTENAVLRILGHASYPHSPGAPTAIVPILQGLRSVPGHCFWPDDLSLVAHAEIDATRLLSAGQITDTYLLALAKAHHGQLATFDRRLACDSVRDGRASLHLIPTPFA